VKRRDRALAILAFALVALACQVAPRVAEAGGIDVLTLSTVRGWFGGKPIAVSGTPTDGHVLTYSSSSGTWVASAAGGGGETLAQTLAIGADGNSVDQTNLGSLTLASGKLVTLNATKIQTGTGSPEGAVTAPLGSIFLRTDGGVGTSLYYKGTGSGNTGWEAVAAGGGSQTPWTSAIDADGYPLQNVGAINGQSGDDVEISGSNEGVGVQGGGVTLLAGTGDGGDSGGARHYQEGGHADGSGGDLDAFSGTGAAGMAGGNVTITSGTGNAGADAAAIVKLFGGNGSGTAGHVTVTGALSGTGTTTGFKLSVVNPSDGATLAAADAMKVHTNAGASASISVTLPTAAAGLTFVFVSEDADPFRIIAAAGDNIRTSVVTTNTAGYLRTTTIGSTLRLTAVDATTWQAEPTGVWQVDSTTQAGYAYTPTDWTSFTPTGTWTTNVTYTGRRRQVGEYMEIQYHIDFTGAPDASQLGFDMPTGFAVDETILADAGGNASVGHGQVRDVDITGLMYPLNVIYFESNNTLYPYSYASPQASTTNTAPVSFGDAHQLEVFVKVPVE